jgi:hypothetical protein
MVPIWLEFMSVTRCAGNLCALQRRELAAIAVAQLK